MSEVHDLVGVGVGPFNLSIAALADGCDSIDARFLEAEGSFSWHSGMMLPGARLQMSAMKDLVTPVDPTSPHSFANYLVEHDRFYEWIHAELPAVSRREFADYMAWVADRLDDVAFGRRVHALTYDQDAFEVHADGLAEPLRARSVVLGTGQVPSVPSCAEDQLGERAFHSSQIMAKELDLSDREVAIVGGGQSGAEVLSAVLDEHWGTPERVDWITRRPNFQPLDDVAFSNEYFTPAYAEDFYELAPEEKRELVAEQKLASDGVSRSDLRSLYRRLYEHRAVGDQRPEVRLRPGRELSSFEAGIPHVLGCEHVSSGGRERSTADVVVFCTGYRYRVPDLLDPIADTIAFADEQPFELAEDFQVRWDGPDRLALYAVNAGRYSHGIAEPQMSLMAWRGAKILNSVAGETVLEPAESLDMVDWAPSASREDPRARSQPIGPRP